MPRRPIRSPSSRRPRSWSPDFAGSSRRRSGRAAPGRKVAAGAPAEQAGLQAGDEIQAINDVAIVGADGSKIMDIVHATQPGQHLRLKVRRDGAERLVDIVAGASK